MLYGGVIISSNSISRKALSVGSFIMKEISIKFLYFPLPCMS